MDETWATIILAIIIFYVLWKIAWQVFNTKIFPRIIRHDTKEIGRNPKWAISRLQYYGFNDIDIVLCECKWNILPCFYINKQNRLELWIDNDTPVNDIENLGRLALIAKIKIKYGLWFPDKSIHWLSILCYMLDGKDINMSEVSWEEVSDDKQE